VQFFRAPLPVKDDDGSIVDGRNILITSYAKALRASLRLQ
jgi:hypothetical protein